MLVLPRHLVLRETGLAYSAISDLPHCLGGFSLLERVAITSWFRAWAEVMVKYTHHVHSNTSHLALSAFQSIAVTLDGKRWLGMPRNMAPNSDPPGCISRPDVSMERLPRQCL